MVLCNKSPIRFIFWSSLNEEQSEALDLENSMCGSYGQISIQGTENQCFGHLRNFIAPAKSDRDLGTRSLENYFKVLLDELVEHYRFEEKSVRRMSKADYIPTHSQLLIPLKTKQTKIYYSFSVKSAQ